MDSPTAAAYLRETARLIREQADAASPGPWIRHHAAGTGYPTLPHVVKLPGQQSGDLAMISTAKRADAEHIAGWDPPTAIAAAALFEAVAANWEATPYGRGDGSVPTDNTVLAFARTYRGDAR